MKRVKNKEPGVKSQELGNFFVLILDSCFLTLLFFSVLLIEEMITVNE